VPGESVIREGSFLRRGAGSQEGRRRQKAMVSSLTWRCTGANHLCMKVVNALQIRQSLGKILDEVERSGEPVLVERGRQPKAVLVPLRLFRERFVDKTVHEERLLLERHIRERQQVRPRKGPAAVDLLRALRGPLP
jgi:prevent-host-death family protein